MPRLRLTLAYDGTQFAGWQLQAPGGGRTVQSCLEEALARLCGAPVRVHGAGRTDSGVHAMAQVAHCDIPEHRAAIPWQRALNALLPDDVSIVDATPVADDFHARFSATGKIYRYTLWIAPGHILPWRRAYVWDVGRYSPLDVAAMDACAALFVGYNDFAAFQNAGTEVKGTVRTLEPIRREPGQHPCEWVFRFQADGFLKQMVRNLMGMLVEVGRGGMSPEEAKGVLASLDRRLAPATAPPQGLTLEEVVY